MSVTLGDWWLSSLSLAVSRETILHHYEWLVNRSYKWVGCSILRSPLSFTPPQYIYIYTYYIRCCIFSSIFPLNRFLERLGQIKKKKLLIDGPSSSAEETLRLPSANIVNWVVLSTNSIKWSFLGGFSKPENMVRTFKHCDEHLTPSRMHSMSYPCVGCMPTSYTALYCTLPSA